MHLEVAKYEGLGNDFLVVDARSRPKADEIHALAPSHAVLLCDRHRGVGADGVLVLERAGTGSAAMRILNADGSEPEMCGNGARCVALHLVRTDRARHDDVLVIDTPAGPHACRVLELSEDASGAVIEVTMRPASLEPADAHVAGVAAPLRDALLDFDDRSVRMTVVSMGNPHAVTFDDGARAERETLGPRIERDARFARGVNVSFAVMIGRAAIELDVWERGAGWTRACGTGACATAVAAVETGRADRGAPIDVRLPGGTLTIRVGAPADGVLMTGPARHVFDAVVDVRALAAERR